MTTIYQIWQVNGTTHEYTYHSSHFDFNVAKDKIINFVETFKQKNAAFTHNTTTKISNAAVSLQDKAGQVILMYLIQEDNIKDTPPPPNKQNMNKRDVIQDTHDSVQTMYDIYINVRQQLIHAIKTDPDIAAAVSMAPGPGPNGTPKDSKMFVRKPQDLTPSRMLSIVNYLHKRNVDINNI